MRPRFTFLLAPLLAVVCAVLSACSSGANASWPDGVELDHRYDTESLVGGIYASPPNDPSCCWVTRNTEFRVPKTEAATDFALKIYLPATPTFVHHPQAFTAVLDGRYRIERCCFRPGLHTVLFPLPPALRDRKGVIGVHLAMRQTFIPDREGFKGDRRELAAIVRSVDFRSL